MSAWFRDEGAERAKLQKKLAYQAELQAQIRSDEEAKRLRKAADRSNEFVHPAAIGIKPYARVSDGSRDVLAAEVQQQHGGRRHVAPPAAHEDEHVHSKRHFAGRDQHESADDSGQLFRRARSMQDDEGSDYEQRRDPRERERERERGRPRERDRTPERGDDPPPRRSNSFPPRGGLGGGNSDRSRSSLPPPTQPQPPQEYKPSTRYMHHQDDYAERAKMEKKLQYQAELQAQIRQNEEAKRQQKFADRYGSGNGVANNNIGAGARSGGAQAVVPYNPPAAAAPSYQQQQQQQPLSHRGGGRDEYDRDSYDEYSRAPARYADDPRDLPRVEPPNNQFGDMLDALMLYRPPPPPREPEPAYRDEYAPRNEYGSGGGYGSGSYGGGGGGRGYDAPLSPRQQQQPPQRQVQWAQPERQGGGGGGYSGGGNYPPSPSRSSFQQPPPQQQQQQAQRGGISDLRAGPTDAQASAKAAKAADYAAELRAQMEANQARKASSAENLRRREIAEAVEAQGYNPWGKGGAGAPTRDQAGNIITNRKQLLALAENNSLHSPNRGGGGGGGGGGGYRDDPPPQQQQRNDYLSPTRRDAPYSSAFNAGPNNNAGSNVGHGGAGAEDGDEKFTRFKFSELRPDEQKDILMARGKKNDYASLLAEQVEAKRRRVQEAKEREEREERAREEKAKREIEQHNALAEAEKSSQKRAHALETQAALDAAQAKLASPKRGGGGRAPYEPEENKQSTNSGVGGYLSPHAREARERQQAAANAQLRQQEQHDRPDSADSSPRRSPRSGGGGSNAAARRRRRRRAEESVEEDELDAVLAAEAKNLRRELENNSNGRDLRSSGLAPALHGRRSGRSERELMGATGLPAALLSHASGGTGSRYDAPPPRRSDRRPRSRGLDVMRGGDPHSYRSHAGAGDAHGSTDAYVMELRKQNQLAQQQLALAQAALRQRGVNPAIIGAPAPMPVQRQPSSFDDDEETDLLRAVSGLHIDDALDLERKRMHSRGGALVAMRPPVPAHAAAAPFSTAPYSSSAVSSARPRPSSSFSRAGGMSLASRPQTGQSDGGAYGIEIDESDDALQMLQQLHLGLPKGIARTQQGHLALRAPPGHPAAAAAAHRSQSTGMLLDLPTRSHMLAADRSVNFDESGDLGALPVFAPSAAAGHGRRGGNPLEQSMSAHSHLVFADHEIDPLFTPGRPGSAAPHSHMRPRTPLSHRTLERETMQLVSASLPPSPQPPKQHLQQQSHQPAAQDRHPASPKQPQPPRPASKERPLHPAASSSVSHVAVPAARPAASKEPLHAPAQSTSPSVSARGAPSISMGQDSYVAAQRAHLLNDDAQQPPHHKPAAHGGVGGGDGGFTKRGPVARTPPGHVGAAGGMVGSSAHATSSHATATVHVDANGNPVDDAVDHHAPVADPEESLDASFAVHQTKSDEPDDAYADDNFVEPAEVEAAAHAQAHGQDTSAGFVDEHGNPVDEHGNLVDEHGNPLPAGFVDEHGNPVDQDGNPLDENGNPILPAGGYVDEHGNPVDEHGNPLGAAGQEQYTDEHGNPVDQHGNPLYTQDQQEHGGAEDFTVHHAGPDTGASVALDSTRQRSQKAQRTAANNAQLNDLMAQQESTDPAWRATKGGGGGLVPTDPERKGTALPLEGVPGALSTGSISARRGSAGAASSRRK